ncbi:hypothetical protein LHFGNBLO_003047 [Mesorhizobium sp. AR10]|uniref:hypothetical protein n=1 Tax=Mesorhizobium sp. AR10 TaxID=2865839 RepID=UPI00215FF6D8|nr:hypothetical protein [Mesorhizobium sp. AR10]UVK36158.1 hypothetical protein LHFGNBLO_003047 [Mesorhizobium sp. AR10]
MPDSVHENPNRPHLAVVCVQIMTFRPQCSFAKQAARSHDKHKTLILRNVLDSQHRAFTGKLPFRIAKMKKAGTKPALILLGRGD